LKVENHCLWCGVTSSVWWQSSWLDRYSRASGIVFSAWTEFTVAPVRGVNTRQEWHRSHAWQRFKRTKGVKLNSILECKRVFLSKNEHRTSLNELPLVRSNLVSNRPS
jgi:hypothetical protein